MIREGDGIAARVLANLGVQLPKVRSAVEFIIGRGDGLVVGDPGLTPRARKVIELAMDEARRLNNHYIGTEHLLLGLVREGEGIAAGVLVSLSVSLEEVRQSVMRVVSPSSTSQQLPELYAEGKLVRADIEREREINARRLWKLLLALPDENFTHLENIADLRESSFAELIREAIRRVWLTEEETETSPAE